MARMSTGGQRFGGSDGDLHPAPQARRASLGHARRGAGLGDHRARGQTPAKTGEERAALEALTVAEQQAAAYSGHWCRAVRVTEFLYPTATTLHSGVEQLEPSHSPSCSFRGSEWPLPSVSMTSIQAPE